MSHEDLSSRNPTVTVIIGLSTHGELPDVLDALEAQTVGPDRFEVLAVNTGHQLTPADSHALAGPRPLRIRLLDAVGGRAAAWNRGITQARAELVIMLADDFIPTPPLVEHHLRLHTEDAAPELVGIGPTLFPERIRRDRFARWIEDSGELLGVSFTRLSDELPAGWFYCANTSAKRSFLLDAGGFDERFPRDACDDAEFGFRLAARGMRTTYLPGAVSTHEHPLTLRERRGVMVYAGEANAIHDSIYPRPHEWNSGDDQRRRPSLAATSWARIRHLVWRRELDHATYYERVLERARLGGYRRAAGRHDGMRGEAMISRRDPLRS